MKKKRKYVPWMFLAPSLILYLCFCIYPTLNAIRISFYEWSGFTEDMKFVGFKNYINLIRDDSFLAAFKNTFLILIVGGLGIFLLAFIFSILLNSGIRGKKLYRSIIFFPIMIGQIVYAIYWGLLIYSPRNGIISQFFKLLKIKKLMEFTFTGSENIFWSVLFVVVWAYVGFYLILLLAGIDRIPISLYEAARIEGANESQVFFRITLPLLKEVLAISIILWSITALKFFDLFFAFEGVMPPRELWTSSIFLYIVGFGKRTPIFKLGYASAIGVVTLLVILIIALIIRKSISRGETYQY